MTTTADLALRPVRHPMATDCYRVIWRGIAVGSLCIHLAAGDRRYYAWAINTVERLPFATRGATETREAAMIAFRQAWQRFSEDAGRMAAFLASKYNIALRAQNWGHPPPPGSREARELDDELAALARYYGANATSQVLRRAPIGDAS